MPQPGETAPLTSHEVNTTDTTARFVKAMRKGLELVLVRFRNGRTRENSHLGNLPKNCPLIPKALDGFPDIIDDGTIDGECVFIESPYVNGILTPACSNCGKRMTCSVFTNAAIIANELTDDQLNYAGIDKIREIQTLRAATGKASGHQIHHDRLPFDPYVPDDTLRHTEPAWSTDEGGLLPGEKRETTADRPEKVAAEEDLED